MTTAKDLLSLPSLSHMKLIGGAAGLSRTVTWPYVILCPPIGEWVSGGEFLIYYGANAVVEKVELAQLIRDAAQNDAAGILFLVGHHYILEENLDDEIRQLADKLKLPVFSHTSLAYVNSITKDIINLIQDRAKDAAIANSFWYSLFFQNTNVDDIATLNQALFLGYLPSYNYCVYIFEMMNASAYFQKLEAMHGPSFTETSSEFFRMLATKLSYITQKETGSTWHVARNSANVFVLPINTNSQEQSADRFFESLTMRMEQQYPGTKFCVGKGNVRSRLFGIRESYIQAKRSLLSWKLLGDNRRLISYSDLGFYQLLFEIPTASVMREYTARFLDPIREYDKAHDAHLYETLCMWLDCRCNKVQTANALFLHRNTLLMRLEKLEKLLGVSLDDADITFQLQTAVKIDKFLSET